MSLVRLLTSDNTHRPRFTIENRKIKFSNQLRLFCAHHSNGKFYVITRDPIHDQYNVKINGYNFECSHNYRLVDVFNITNVKSYSISNFTVSDGRINCCFTTQTLTSVNFSGWRLNVEDMCNMFTLCPNLKSIKCIGWIVPYVINIHGFIGFCPSLERFICKDWDFGSLESITQFFSSESAPIFTSFMRFKAPELRSIKKCFICCEKLRHIKLIDIDTPNLTDMSCCFQNCSNLETVIIRNWNAPYLQDIHKMFKDCSNLKHVTLEINSRLISDMSRCFAGCKSLQTLNLIIPGLTKLKDITKTFYYCASLTNLDLSWWAPEELESGYKSFAYCHQLRSINVNGWNTGYTYSFERCFYQCGNLITIHMESWFINGSTSVNQIFGECKSLVNVHCGKEAYEILSDYNEWI